MACPPSELLRDRLRSRRPYWVATMHKMGSMCALTPSILAGGYRLGWDGTMVPPAPGLFPNAKSAFTATEFVSAAIAEGICLGTMATCARAQSLCDCAWIWDGSHVNQHLPHEPFHMNSLQREGLALCVHGTFPGTFTHVSVLPYFFVCIRQFRGMPYEL
jgi:hypothetical protein